MGCDGKRNVEEYVSDLCDPLLLKHCVGKKNSPLWLHFLGKYQIRRNYGLITWKHFIWL